MDEAMARRAVHVTYPHHITRDKKTYTLNSGKMDKLYRPVLTKRISLLVAEMKIDATAGENLTDKQLFDTIAIGTKKNSLRAGLEPATS